MKILKTAFALGCSSFVLTLSSTAFAQDAPEVVDSYPKQILKERAERRAAEREAARAAADAAVNNSVPAGPVTSGSSPMGIEMVVINPGAGKLGSPDFEKKRGKNENPYRDTLIGYRFEVSKYEITFDQWEKCVSVGGCEGHKPNDNEWGRGNRPVINISFNDAQNFVTWLSAKTGQTYRLLSEAEWEYVARAGQDAPFGNGYDMSAQVANFNGKAPYGSGADGPYLRKTNPVGQYEANAFGVHDMHGNVYEWVEDCWNSSHSGAIGDGSPRKDGDCKYRVMKGGSWAAHGYQTRAAARIRYVTDYRYDDYGIRIARTLN